MGIEWGEITKGDNARVMEEVWNKRAWVYWIIQEDSALNFPWEGIIRWRKSKITRRLIIYLNITYPAWSGKLKRFGKIWWDKVNMIDTSEGER